MSLLLALILAFGITASAFAAGSSYDNATSVSFGRTYNDMLSTGWEEDFFKFTLYDSSTVELEFTSEIPITLFMYNSDNEKIWRSDFLIPDSISGVLTYSNEFNLSEGTYYLVVGDTYETGNYSFELNSTSNSDDSSDSGSTGFFLFDIFLFIVGFIAIVFFGY